MKVFDKVKVIGKYNIYIEKIGIVYGIEKKSPYPYNVVFGMDKYTNPITGVFTRKDLIIVGDE